MLNRTEVNWTGKSVVDHRYKSVGSCELDNRLMVRHLQQWIRHCLNVDRFGVGTPFLLPGLRVISIDEIIGYPECMEVFRDKVVGPTVQAVLDEQVISIMEKCKQAGGDCRHSARSYESVFRTLNRGQLPMESLRVRRIVQSNIPNIMVAGFVAGFEHGRLEDRHTH